MDPFVEGGGGVGGGGRNWGAYQRGSTTCNGRDMRRPPLCPCHTTNTIPPDTCCSACDCIPRSCESAPVVELRDTGIQYSLSHTLQRGHGLLVSLI